MMRKTLLAAVIMMFGWLDAFALEVHEVTTPKGIKLWFSPDKTVPIISISFSFKDAGSAHEVPELKGLTELACHMLLEGTKHYPATTLHEKLAELGIELGFSTSPDFLRGNLRTTLRTKTEAIDLLRQVLYESQFNADRLEILKQQTIAYLRNQAQKPDYMLTRLVNETLYANHPYALPEVGTEETIQRIAVTDIKTGLHQKMARSNLQVAICGNMTTAEAIEMVDQIFAGLPEQAETTALPDLKLSYADRTVLKQTEYPQSVAILVTKGLPYKDDSLMMLQLVSQILGGGLESRLGKEIRERHGLAYVIDSMLSHREKAAHFQVYIGSDNAKINRAFDAIKSEMTKITRFGITEQELKEAQQNLIGSFVLSLSSTASIAAKLRFYQEEGFSASYVNQRAQIIRAIRLDQINDFIRTFFDPKQLTVFVVGNPS